MNKQIKTAIALAVPVILAVTLTITTGDDIGKLNGKVLNQVRDFGASVAEVVE